MTTTRPTGRPLQFDPDAVVNTVMDLFWRHGYQATSIGDIEEATGVTRTSLYNHFGSKDGLIGAAIDRYLAQVQGMVIEPLLAGERGLDDVDEFFHRMADAVLREGVPPGCMVLSYIEELGAMERFKGTPSAHVRSFGDALTSALTRAAELGEIPHATIDDRARLLEAMVVGIQVIQPATDSPGSTRAALDAARTQVREWRRPPAPEAGAFTPDL